MIKKDEFIFYTMPCTKAAAIYYDPETESRACLLYFHGGGLVYGSKDDLPALHLQTLCEQGFRIIAFDYPLAPQASIGEILEDVIDSINAYIQGRVDPCCGFSAVFPLGPFGRRVSMLAGAGLRPAAGDPARSAFFLRLRSSDRSLVRCAESALLSASIRCTAVCLPVSEPGRRCTTSGHETILGRRIFALCLWQADRHVAEAALP